MILEMTTLMRSTAILYFVIVILVIAVNVYKLITRYRRYKSLTSDQERYSEDFIKEISKLSKKSGKSSKDINAWVAQYGGRKTPSIETTKPVRFVPKDMETCDFHDWQEDKDAKEGEHHLKCSQCNQRPGEIK